MIAGSVANSVDDKIEDSIHWANQCLIRSRIGSDDPGAPDYPEPQ